jgi:hypothetical protein
MCVAPALGYTWTNTDASNVRTEGALSLKQEGQKRVVGHNSKILSRAEYYCVTQWELLAIVKTTEHCHKYLNKQELHLHTDHSALT